MFNSQIILFQFFFSSFTVEMEEMPEMSQVSIPVAVRGRTGDKEQAIKLPSADEPSNEGLEAPWFLPLW